MISQIISEYDKDLKSKHAGQSTADMPILEVSQNHPLKIIQTVAKIEIQPTVCMIFYIICVTFSNLGMFLCKTEQQTKRMN